MIPVVWLWLIDEDHNGFWDWALLKDTLNRSRYEFKDYTSEKFTQKGGAVVVIPARQHAEMVTAINLYLSKLEWCLVILTGDEEASFPVDKLNHPNMVVWAMHRGDTDARFPNGYTPHTRPNLPPRAPQKDLDWFFAGQTVNNPTRQKMVEEMRDVPGGLLIETEGFAQGDPVEYMKHMARARAVLCPPGPVIDETFRWYEAVEAGATPIKHWQDVHFYMDTKWSNDASAIWQGMKRDWATRLEDTVENLSGISPKRQEVTVLIPTSPTHLHPDTGYVEETIESVRERLPEAEIIVMFDGVRPEQEKFREVYEEYQRRLLWQLNHRWDHTLPLRFEIHSHQAKMTTEALKYVRTPYVLFVEHDTPLCGKIDFGKVIAALDELDVLRFYPEGRLEPEHAHLMLDDSPAKIKGVPVVRTSQWSQRPHIAKTDYYRGILEKWFTNPDKSIKITMIEDVLHSIAQSSHDLPEEYGTHRIGIYHPKGDIKRSTHSDARGSEPKFEESFEV